MEYNITKYMEAVKKALKEFDRIYKGKKKMSQPTAPKTQYAKAKKPAAKPKKK